MQLQVMADRLPGESPLKPPLGRIIELMGRVIDGGWNTLRGLRLSRGGSLIWNRPFHESSKNLACSGKLGFASLCKASGDRCARCCATIYRIGREALVNAFRHSGAKSIEVEVEDSARQLRILVATTAAGSIHSYFSRGAMGTGVCRARAKGLNAWADGSAFGAARRPEQRWGCPCPAISPFEAIVEPRGRHPGLRGSGNRHCEQAGVDAGRSATRILPANVPSSLF